ncbi:MAG: hypothetical protein ACK4GN_15195 [Runella sp.]
MNTYTLPSKILLVAIFLILHGHSIAQQPNTSKIVQTTQRIGEQSAVFTNQTQQTAANLQAAIDNAKMALKVFEPILKLRLRKKAITDQTTANTTNSTLGGGGSEPTFEAPPLPNSILTPADSAAAYQYQQTSVTPDDINRQVPIITQSPVYNPDGTANLGTQNHRSYGCYIDIINGAIMDDIDAAGNSRSIDLIFTATDAFNSQVPMYAFLTPAYAKNDAFAYNFFKGVKFKDQNIPPKTWETVNESELAFAPISGEQFERIQTNAQLTAVVKQCTGFAQKLESRTKLDGKVIAVKTEMGSRTAYGLMYVVNHYGTIGENGYLRIKLKVTGFDANGDGNPDAGLYR